MDKFFAGVGVGFLFCFIFVASVLGTNRREQHTPEGIEKRAKISYETYWNERDWYTNDKHIEPWSRLSEQEKENWRRPLVNCGPGH